MGSYGGATSPDSAIVILLL